jgi:hypothetical protein
VYTVLGKNAIHQAGNDLDTFELNISELENGIYFIEINTKSGNVITKFIKN